MWRSLSSPAPPGGRVWLSGVCGRIPWIQLEGNPWSLWWGCDTGSGRTPARSPRWCCSEDGSSGWSPSAAGLVLAEAEHLNGKSRQGNISQAVTMTSLKHIYDFTNSKHMVSHWNAHILQHNMTLNDSNLNLQAVRYWLLAQAAYDHLPLLYAQKLCVSVLRASLLLFTRHPKKP